MSQQSESLSDFIDDLARAMARATSALDELTQAALNTDASAADDIRSTLTRDELIESYYVNALDTLKNAESIFALQTRALAIAGISALINEIQDRTVDLTT